MSEEISENISWTSLLEEYFSSVGEKSNCYSWLHSRAEGYYSVRKSIIDLPVIVLSGAIGFCSVGTSSMFAGEEKAASIALGMLSLVVSVLNTVSSYYQFSKKAEGHRIAALHYAKLYRFICVEMGLPREERIRTSDLLKMVKNEFDRLAETAPSLPESIIQEFRQRFSDDKYAEVSRPTETNGLEKVTVYETSMSRAPSLTIQSPTPTSSMGFYVTERPQALRASGKPARTDSAGNSKSFVPPPERAATKAVSENQANTTEAASSSHAPDSQSNSQASDTPAHSEHQNSAIFYVP